LQAQSREVTTPELRERIVHHHDVAHRSAGAACTGEVRLDDGDPKMWRECVGDRSTDHTGTDHHHIGDHPRPEMKGSRGSNSSVPRANRKSTRLNSSHVKI